MRAVRHVVIIPVVIEAGLEEIKTSFADLKLVCDLIFSDDSGIACR
jgi:hypothetical protein